MSAVLMDQLVVGCQPRHLAMLAWALGEQQGAPGGWQEGLVGQQGATAGWQGELREQVAGFSQTGGGGCFDQRMMVHDALGRVAKEATGRCGAHDLANIAWALAQQVHLGMFTHAEV